MTSLFTGRKPAIKVMSVFYGGEVYHRNGQQTDMPKADKSSWDFVKNETLYKNMENDRDLFLQLYNLAVVRVKGIEEAKGKEYTVHLAHKTTVFKWSSKDGAADCKNNYDAMVKERDHHFDELVKLVERYKELEQDPVEVRTGAAASIAQMLAEGAAAKASSPPAAAAAGGTGGVRPKVDDVSEIEEAEPSAGERAELEELRRRQNQSVLEDSEEEEAGSSEEDGVAHVARTMSEPRQSSGAPTVVESSIASESDAPGMGAKSDAEDVRESLRFLQAVRGYLETTSVPDTWLKFERHMSFISEIHKTLELTTPVDDLGDMRKRILALKITDSQSKRAQDAMQAANYDKMRPLDDNVKLVLQQLEKTERIVQQKNTELRQKNAEMHELLKKQNTVDFNNIQLTDKWEKTANKLRCSVDDLSSHIDDLSSLRDQLKRLLHVTSDSMQDLENAFDFFFRDVTHIQSVFQALDLPEAIDKATTLVNSRRDTPAGASANDMRTLREANLRLSTEVDSLTKYVHALEDEIRRFQADPSTRSSSTRDPQFDVQLSKLLGQLQNLVQSNFGKSPHYRLPHEELVHRIVQIIRSCFSDHNCDQYIGYLIGQLAHHIHLHVTVNDNHGHIHYQYEDSDDSVRVEHASTHAVEGEGYGSAVTHALVHVGDGVPASSTHRPSDEGHTAGARTDDGAHESALSMIASAGRTPTAGRKVTMSDVIDVKDFSDVKDVGNVKDFSDDDDDKAHRKKTPVKSPEKKTPEMNKRTSASREFRKKYGMYSDEDSPRSPPAAEAAAAVAKTTKDDAAVKDGVLRHRIPPPQPPSTLEDVKHKEPEQLRKTSRDDALNFGGPPNTGRKDEASAARAPASAGGPPKLPLDDKETGKRLQESSGSVDSVQRSIVAQAAGSTETKGIDVKPPNTQVDAKKPEAPAVSASLAASKPPDVKPPNTQVDNKKTEAPAASASLPNPEKGGAKEDKSDSEKRVGIRQTFINGAKKIVGITSNADLDVISASNPTDDLE
jgi:hypothetical protein